MEKESNCFIFGRISAIEHGIIRWVKKRPSLLVFDVQFSLKRETLFYLGVLRAPVYVELWMCLLGAGMGCQGIKEKGR